MGGTIDVELLLLFPIQKRGANAEPQPLWFCVAGCLWVWAPIGQSFHSQRVPGVKNKLVCASVWGNAASPDIVSHVGHALDSEQILICGVHDAQQTRSEV